MRRVAGLFLSLWTVSILVLAGQTWFSLTPYARYWLRPEAEAELASAFYVRTPLFTIDPTVQVVLPDQKHRWGWHALPATAALVAMRPVFPTPLSSLFHRILILSSAQATVCYLILLLFARCGRDSVLGIPVAPAPAGPGR